MRLFRLNKPITKLTANFAGVVSLLMSVLPNVAYAFPNGDIAQSQLLRIAGGLIFVLAIIMVLFFILKRFNHLGISGNGMFKLLASMSLGPREKLILVNVGGQHLLLGVTTGSINLIQDFGETPPDGLEVASKQSFSTIYKQFRGKRP